jgi:hypothetical protein
VALDERHVFIVPDLRQVVLFDPATATEVWKTQTRWPSMCAPQVVSRPGHLFLLIDGYELQSLDSLLAMLLRHQSEAPAKVAASLAGASGWYGSVRQLFLPPFSMAAWGQPRPDWQRMLSTETINGSALTLDESALYFVSRNILQARSLTDGRRLWDLALVGPAGLWQTVRTRDWLITYPLQAEPDRGFSVVCCDPKDGQMLQRLSFPARGSPATVQIFDRGMAVVLKGNAWGLSGDREER